MSIDFISDDNSIVKFSECKLFISFFFFLHKNEKRTTIIKKYNSALHAVLLLRKGSLVFFLIFDDLLTTIDEVDQSIDQINQNKKQNLDEIFFHFCNEIYT